MADVPLDHVPLPDPAADTGAHRDPLSGEVGMHPVGVGLGAVAGGLAAGAAAGTLAGPVGAVIGAALGAIAGGLAGKGAAEVVAPTSDDAYWRANYATRAYASMHDDDYEVWASPHRHQGTMPEDRRPERHVEQIEPMPAAGWDGPRDPSTLEWEMRRDATHDAWDRGRPR